MIEIVHKYTRAVLYRSEDAETLRGAVVAAVAAKADLRGSDLSGWLPADAILSMKGGEG